MLSNLCFLITKIEWKTAKRYPRWFLIVHIPFMWTVLLQCLYKPLYKNVYYNIKVYDGLTRNDFMRGRFIEILCKLEAIEKPLNYESDTDGRSYFTGVKQDD